MRILLTAILLCCAANAAAQQLKPWGGGATPPLALVDVGGRLYRLDDYRGKVVLVNFWATWCEPCREEMPSINRLRASLAGRPFEVLAVNLAESESRIRRFVEQLPLEFPVLMDRDGAAAKSWRARLLPMKLSGRSRRQDPLFGGGRNGLGAGRGAQGGARADAAAGFFYSASSGTPGVVPVIALGIRQ